MRILYIPYYFTEKETKLQIINMVYQSHRFTRWPNWTCNPGSLTSSSNAQHPSPSPHLMKAAHAFQSVHPWLLTGPGNPGTAESGNGKVGGNTERKAGSQDWQRPSSAELFILNGATFPRGTGFQSASRFAMSLFIKHIPIFHQAQSGSYGENVDEWGIYSGLKKVIQMRKTDRTLTKSTNCPLCIIYPPLP